MKQWLQTITKDAPSLLMQGLFGLEKEALRVKEDGMLSLSSHPKSLGDKSTHPFITTDFSESQIELISPPLPSLEQAHGFIRTLQDIVYENIGDEYMWTQSLPSLLPDSKYIPIAKFTGDYSGKQDYREYLLATYGPEMQTFSGVHFNFSFPDSIWSWKGIDVVSPEQVYMRMLRNFMRYRWVLVWLFGASPIADGSLKVQKLSSDGKKLIHPECFEGVSLRSGKLGYRNHQFIPLDYSSWKNFQHSIDENIEKGNLIGPQELYQPIRIKTKESNPDQISHIEVRLLDLDPYEYTGISLDTLRFVHLFLIYMVWIEETESLDITRQKEIQNFQDWVCCHGLMEESTIPNDDTVLLKDMVKSFVRRMSFDLDRLGLSIPDDYLQVLNKVESMALFPNNRVVAKLVKDIQDKGFVDFHMSLAKDYKKASLEKGYRFHGLEDMELSTQLLLKAALHRGVSFEMMDRKENFVRLFNPEKESYVVQATKTELDRYNVILMMENKTVTKKVLAPHNIAVPKGDTFFSKQEALSHFTFYQDYKVVVKPQSTNFGLGITILHSTFSREDYIQALDLAFSYDQTVLVEHFVEGEEYRFFLINDRVEGILKRIPANVVGDGIHTIAQLVEIKNEDPLRGQGYRTPLEKLKLGDEERFFLKQTGHSPLDVPQKNQQVFLRENSNISTGGDSLDYTDKIHSSYFDIAQKASKAMGVAITGLDMMIQDITAPATPDNYSIIEMNFNPAIHIHCYPYIGKNRRLNEKILDALGF
ncbi:MAG: bifunctional glutamate--cysteine ligase GshA/glutathione synthetase GshB [Prolixibacteraceae bacterium]|jgi:glutamate--cysteine ligase|nr:bifunctional glutamate--cysteine ligase GshA/glutathione synthetase GshB [Prolixibacteraceae bacterium]